LFCAPAANGKDFPLAVLAEEGCGFLIDPRGIAKLPDQVTPLEAYRVAQSKIFSGWLDFFGLLYDLC
jgi:hypothetical protein